MILVLSAALLSVTLVALCHQRAVAMIEVLHRRICDLERRLEHKADRPTRQRLSCDEHGHPPGSCEHCDYDRSTRLPSARVVRTPGDFKW